MQMNDSTSGAWPELVYSQWKDTCATLHLWTQIVGKVRLACTPWVNHSWHVPLYLTARGLTTSPIARGERSFAIDFDFIDHELIVAVTDGERRRMPLRPETVAEFYVRVMETLVDLGVAVQILDMPSEIADAIPFSTDTRARAYDGRYAQRFWRALIQASRVMSQFRTSFLGKCSPVHFFWGSFDLAVTRFSGRLAPLHGGVVPHLPRAVLREAYSHEVSSVGFWPGGVGVDASFYAYAYPEPAGFQAAAVRPRYAFYSPELGEFILPYDAVRRSTDPDTDLLAFFTTTYEAAADGGGWDRATLECEPGVPRIPRRVG
jgi:hypothetical protein